MKCWASFFPQQLPGSWHLLTLDWNCRFSSQARLWSRCPIFQFCSYCFREIDCKLSCSWNFGLITVPPKHVSERVCLFRSLGLSWQTFEPFWMAKILLSPHHITLFHDRSPCPQQHRFLYALYNIGLGLLAALGVLRMHGEWVSEWATGTAEQLPREPSVGERSKGKSSGTGEQRMKGGGGMLERAWGGEGEGARRGGKEQGKEGREGWMAR